MTNNYQGKPIKFKMGKDSKIEDAILAVFSPKGFTIVYEDDPDSILQCCVNDENSELDLMSIEAVKSAIDNNTIYDAEEVMINWLVKQELTRAAARTYMAASIIKQLTTKGKCGSTNDELHQKCEILRHLN